MSTEKRGNEGVVVDLKVWNYQKNKNTDVSFMVSGIHGLGSGIPTRMGRIERMDAV